MTSSWQRRPHPPPWLRREMLSCTCDGGYTISTLSKTQLPSSWCVCVCIVCVVCVCGWVGGCQKIIHMHCAFLPLPLSPYLYQSIRWVPLLHQDDFAKSLIAMDTTHTTKQVSICSHIPRSHVYSALLGISGMEPGQNG